MGFILWHREQRKGARWRKVLTTRSHAEALAAIDGPGDWHPAPVFDERLLAAATPRPAQPGLFDA